VESRDGRKIVEGRDEGGEEGTKREERRERKRISGKAWGG